MFQSTVLFLALCAGTLVEPFCIAEAEPDHHQGCLRTAMASDGHFAVAWLDSLRVDYPPFCELELFVRFFDQSGNPLTDPYKITKAADTNLIGSSHLDMDSAGNTVLLWTEYPPRNPNEDLLRLQLFDTSGNPLGSPQTDHQGYISWGDNRAVGVCFNNQGEFAIVWDAETICARRYSFQDGPQGDPFVVHDDLPDDVFSDYPSVALSDAGDLVVTWHESHISGHDYPKFQVFDAEDESILPWEPMGHLVLDDSLGGTRVEAYWLDNDRFALFWIDHVSWRVVGRVFADRGLTRCPICRLVHDSLALNWAASVGRFAIALSSNERFAETHTRSYYDYPDGKLRNWEHGAGILGYIQNNEPIRRTTLFEYTPAWGADTVNSFFDNWPHVQPPAVACCDDRLVWVYSRFNTDTIFEAYAMITDWGMGEGVVEQPIVRDASDWEVVTTIGPRIVLRYANHPEGFHVTIFDASGRKVDELHSTQASGTVTWSVKPGSHQSGVYFIRETRGSKAKVVLIR